MSAGVDGAPPDRASAGMVTVFGGSGFLGRRIVARFAAGGREVRVAVRHPEDFVPAKGAATVGRVKTVKADVRDRASVAAALDGADGAVNAVSAYVERGGITYADVHETGVRNVAGACARLGVARLAHVSGIGADAASQSKYIRARGRGEVLVQDVFPDATILRPGVLFGPDDAFLGTLAGIVRHAPIFVLIGGRTRLQPVHVADVAEAVVRVFEDGSTRGRIYELGGSRSYTLREIVAAIMTRLGVRRPMLPLPFPLARIAAALCERMPGAPLTIAQVELLERDNLASADRPGLSDLAIVPRALEESIARLAAPSR